MEELQPTNTISIEDFKKLELRAARILEASEIPGADRIWRLKVEVGGVEKQVVAGIKAQYPDGEALRGKTVILVNNLKPSLIRGVESQGMLLAAKDASGLVLVTTDRPIGSGATIS